MNENEKIGKGEKEEEAGRITKDEKQIENGEGRREREKERKIETRSGERNNE